MLPGISFLLKNTAEALLLPNLLPPCSARPHLGNPSSEFHHSPLMGVNMTVLRSDGGTNGLGTVAQLRSCASISLGSL